MKNKKNRPHKNSARAKNTKNYTKINLDLLSSFLSRPK